jgi:hypothetical protein
LYTNKATGARSGRSWIFTKVDEDKAFMKALASPLKRR